MTPPIAGTTAGSSSTNPFGIGGGRSTSTGSGSKNGYNGGGDDSGGTRVALPPVSSSSTSLGSTGSAAAAAVSDPNALLDAFEDFTSSHRKQQKESLKSKSSFSSITSSQKQKQQHQKSKSPDPIDFLNRQYTTEATLVAQLPFVREVCWERMHRLDDQISSALQRQSETAEATKRQVQDAQASVASLEQRIRQVQQQAQQSEQAVRHITKDMRRLDCAKRHLQRTITTLKRLHMLIHAVEQLRLACLQEPFPDFEAAAHLIDATRLLMHHFEAYRKTVEPISKLSQKVIDLQGELKFTLTRAFRRVGFGKEQTQAMESSSKVKSLRIKPIPKEEENVMDEDMNESDNQFERHMTPAVMMGGVHMIDALGIDTRKQFIQGFCQDQLTEYTKLYKPAKNAPKEKPRVSSFKAQPESPKEEGKPDFCLEYMERRFVWFRNLMTRVNEKFPRVFPAYWNLHYHLTRLFLKLTRQHILALLGPGPTRDSDANNATILLKALQKTLLFEKEVANVLQRDYGTVYYASPTTEVSDDSNIASQRTTTISKKSLQEQKVRTARNSGEDTPDGRASTEQEEVPPLLGLASSAYDNYMGPYIALEEQSMDEQLVESLEDRKVDTRGELPVFTTSTKLFVYIKGSITRCTALTKGNAFYLLYQAFQDSLRKYAQVLSSKLPPPLPQNSGVAGLSIGNVQFGKQDQQQGNLAQAATYRVPKGEEVTVCHVIGTCEYCADTVEALEDLIRDTIDEEFKSKIDMMGQQEAFHDITAKAIRVLVSGLENRLEESIRMMTSTNWATFDEVGEESDYVRYMHKEIQPYVTTARELIPTSYFRSFCDKFALGFTNNYYNTLIRLKRISELGTQQLLLDVYNLKTLLLKLPVLEKSNMPSATSPSRVKSVPAGSTIAPAMYTKMVQKQFKKIELTLKLTGTPAEMLIDVFKNQWQGGSALDLQTVMSLKGMKRNEQAAMLEKFGLDPATALRGATVNVTSATIVSERLQAVQDQAARVNSDLSQMRQKVDDFRRSFR